MACATSTTMNFTAERKHPRLPLLDIHGAITRYKNDLFKGNEEAEHLGCESPSKDDIISELEFRCLHSLQKRKDRALCGVLLQNSDFLSPRSGCLTPLSSARAFVSGHTRLLQIPSERDSVSLPNSSRECRDKPFGLPLQDSLRSRFCKHTSGKENSDSVNSENITSQNEKGPLEQKLNEQGITPVYEPKCSDTKQQIGILPIIPDVSDLRVFLVCPAPKCGGHIQCHMRRIPNNYKLFPKYKLYLSKGDIFLLSSRKRKKSKCSNYIISLDEEDISKRTGNYYGNVQSNFIGTQFLFYDKGEHPLIGKDKSCLQRPLDRVEIGAVMLEPSVFGLRGPRNITAIIPAFNSDDKPYVFYPESHGLPSILHRYKTGYDHEKMIIMKSKVPQWNKELRSYCLNFHGRATHASIKNFQLVTEFNDEHILLQLGKVGKNMFTLDYSYPLSALQAFSIAISTLDRKFP
ncbi:hypothetical protein KP509_19G031400 [Ceratopteris richardii]|uniref:Tubby C-terminal domain-containing protein n=1 Tax=Ceratopteris richardii TaxID=49495 RepID=A0A8T2SJ99_CERRI|nr:hypothetical protein KP509_19G031400 [Ceratopteris richardii]